MSTGPKPLTWLDWVVFAATILISIGIGVYFAFTGGRQRTTSEYLTGNRKLSTIPVSLSMFMSLISGVYVIGQTAEIYFHGTQVWVGLIGSVLGYVLCAIIFVPTFYRLKLISVYETIYMGTAMFAPATSLNAVTGFPVWAIVILTGIVTTFYTSIGGIKAVVWTDVFQGIVLFAGLLAVMIAGTLRVGGISKVWELAESGKRLNWFNFNPDPTIRMNFWSLVVGRFVISIVSIGTTQNNVQRYCSLPSLNKARIAVSLVSLFWVVAASIIFFSGLVIFAYFKAIGCDPLRSGQIRNQNQILPYFIVNILGYPGLSGVFLAVLFSGALSSLSSSLSALSAITWRDLIEGRFKKTSEFRKALVTKFLVLIYGCVGVMFAFVVQYLPGHIMQVSMRLLAGVASPVNGVMWLGVFVPFANAIGSGVGALTGFAMTTWINFGAYGIVPHQAYLETDVRNCTTNSTLPMPTNPPASAIFPLYRLSFLLVGMVGILATVLAGSVVSCILGGEKKERRDGRLIIPPSRLCFRCCPASVKQVTSCGVSDYTEEDVTDKELETNEEKNFKPNNGVFVLGRKGSYNLKQ